METRSAHHPHCGSSSRRAEVPHLEYFWPNPLVRRSVSFHRRQPKWSRCPSSVRPTRLLNDSPMNTFPYKASVFVSLRLQLLVLDTDESDWTLPPDHLTLSKHLCLHFTCLFIHTSTSQTNSFERDLEIQPLNRKCAETFTFFWLINFQKLAEGQLQDLQLYKSNRVTRQPS